MMQFKTKGKVKDWHDKLFNLIEKEISIFDTRPKSRQKEHLGGECYINDIFRLVENLLKEKTVCCMAGCGNAICKHCR